MIRRCQRPHTSSLQINEKFSRGPTEQLPDKIVRAEQAATAAATAREPAEQAPSPKLTPRGPELRQIERQR